MLDHTFGEPMRDETTDEPGPTAVAELGDVRARIADPNG
jgi:hypothetical protein